MATKKKAGRISVPIRLDPREVERIDALMATVKESEAAREFGVKVDRGLVLRIAVIRGLQVMEAGAAGPSAAQCHPLPSSIFHASPLACVTPL